MTVYCLKFVKFTIISSFFLVLIFRNKYVAAKFDEVDYISFNSINVAIEENATSGVNVKNKLGNNLIIILDQLLFNFYLEHKNKFEEMIRTGYEKTKKILGFKLIGKI